MKKIKKSKEKEKPEQRRTEKVKQQQLDKRERKPFLLIDKSGDPISNFISNFIRQFRNPTSTGLLKLSELFNIIKTKRPDVEKEHTKISDIMGPSKTVFSFEKKKSTEDGKINESKAISQDMRHTNSNTIKEKQGYETRKPLDIKPKIRM